MKVKLLLLLAIHMLVAAQDKQDNKEAEVIRDIKPESTSAPEQDNVCVLVNPTGVDATLHTVPKKGVEAFMAKLAKGGDADARIVEMGDCQAETSEEKELGMRLATARTGEQEEMEPLSSDPDCHEFEMAVAFAGTPGDHFSAAMNSAKLSIGEADEEKQMMMDSSSAAQLLSVQVGEKDGLTHAFFRHGSWYCKNQRRSLEDMSTLERGIYVVSLIHLKNEGRTAGTAQDMASIDIMKFMNYHGTFGSHAHWNPHFLAWHREYLRHWEEMMMESWESIQNDGTTPYAPAGLHQWAIALFAEQGIVVTAADIKSNCIALPYWAWEHDAGKTASGRAFSEPSTLGSSGWGQSGNCVADGLSKWTGVEADADWLIAGTPKCLKRSYNPAGTVNTFDLSQWASMLTISGYCSFANSAEGGIHYAPHTYVSGTMGSVSTAGREHLFYLHHNNIDRLWSEWQEYAPGNKFDYDDCGTSKGVNDPMPPFDGTTYAEATPADVLDQSNYWKHKCVRPKWGPFFVSKLKATQAQATHLQQRTLEAVPLAWPVALRTSRTCYGADYVPHGRKCKFVVDGWLSHAHQVKMKLAKVWDAGLGGQIPGLGALMDKTQKDAMFDTAKWREFGFTEDMTRNLAARFTRSQLSQEEIARWAPHLDPANKREVFGGIPEDWITEGFLDELINKIDHADTCKSDGSRHGLQIEDGE